MHYSLHTPISRRFLPRIGIANSPEQNHAGLLGQFLNSPEQDHVGLLGRFINSPISVPPSITRQYRLVRMTQYITGAELPAIQDLYTRWCQRKAWNIVKDTHHLSHRMFSANAQQAVIQRQVWDQGS